MPHSLGSQVLRRWSRWARIPIVIFGLACTSTTDGSQEGPDFVELRRRMVERQLRGRQISDPRVLAAMSRVPRHELVPQDQRARAYQDSPLPIGFGQTISQPFIVALMTQSVAASAADKVLEVGTGSGYQAAVLSELCQTVLSIEIVPQLAERAARDLERLGYDNVQVRSGDGYAGWPEEAPFDIIIITAAADQIPPPLLEQLAPGGRLIMPVGRVNDVQELTLVRNQDGELRRTRITPVRFVPLTRKPGPTQP